MDKLFEQFLNEKLYLKGVSKQTIQWYHYSFKAFKKSLTGDITKQMLADFVIELRKSGVSTTTMNDYIRGVNVFLGWLYENEYIPKVLKIKRVKQEETIIETFTDKHLEAFISYKPKDAAEIRLHTLLLFLIDTGCRIEEAITLVRENVDLDSLAVKVRGKGQKERIVPVSLELRKSLFRFLKTHTFDLVFCTRDGKPLMYRNILRDFKNLAHQLGISGVRISFHTLRHTFAVNYVRHGGNIFYLQRAMGHTDLSMTRRYVNLQTEDLQKAHMKLSTLSRLK
jgi:integrase/recombinase XerD